MQEIAVRPVPFFVVAGLYIVFLAIIGVCLFKRCPRGRKRSI